MSPAATSSTAPTWCSSLVIVGIDTGGTFTDFVVLGAGEPRIHKVPSTPDDPARAVIEGLGELAGFDIPAFDAAARDAASIVHGSTVATNALLERRGARVVLITTAGFEDVIEIGRQARSAIYDLDVTKAPPLVPPERRLGARERVGPDGDVLAALEAEEVERLLTEVDRLLSGTPAAGPDAAAVGAAAPMAVAVCLLHSYAHPEHEAKLADALRARGPKTFVSVSHEVLPEFREYERTSTTVVNAFVGPVMSRYLGRLAESLDPDRVRIMSSNGGVSTLAAAGRLAVHTILSGPAGGAVGGFEVGRAAGHPNVITFDMGGTSTDVSLCEGRLTRTSETVIGDLPIRVPVIDVHTVGAGGGSIAYRDPGGALRVGPESAGADPGPVCYGQGGERATVTDAHVYLGRLPPDHFLGGTRRLEVAPVERAIEALARELGIEPRGAAEGVIRVANATMERAIRVISLERGYDPKDFTLVCFGGAGALHAADLARVLGLPRVLVPPAAGTLSALGMLLAEPIRDYSQTLMVPAEGAEAGTLERAFEGLEDRARRELSADGLPPEKTRFERSLELRYAGQGYELAVPYDEGFAVSFHAAHERRYGYADPERACEVVNVRVRATTSVEKPAFRERDLGEEDPGAAVLGEHRFVYAGEEHAGLVMDRERLAPGNTFSGPAIVVEYSTTTVVPPGAAGAVDRFGNLLLEWTS